MDALTETLGVRVRQLRNTKGWSQEELAHRAGLSLRYVGYVERCEGSATVAILGKLARALDVEPCELIRRRERGTPTSKR